MPGQAPPGLHGSPAVAEGQLMGATDTDYFYFCCPGCGDSTMLRLLDYYVIDEGPRSYAPDQRRDARRDFILSFPLKCDACGFEDAVKLSNTGWQGGRLADVLGRQGETLKWSK